MKAIKILDTDETSEYVVLTNFMGYEIDKEDHVLQIHRYTDGDDLFYNIQLKAWGFFESDTPNPLMPTQHGLFADAYSIVEEKMEEFLADDDESILDISEYVDQDVMMRGDEEEKPMLKQYIEGMTPQKVRLILGEEEEDPHCSHCGKYSDHLAYIKQSDKRYCSIRCNIAASEKLRKASEEEEDEAFDEDAYIETLDLVCKRWIDAINA